MQFVQTVWSQEKQNCSRTFQMALLVNLIWSCNSYIALSSNSTNIKCSLYHDTDKGTDPKYQNKKTVWQNKDCHDTWNDERCPCFLPTTELICWIPRKIFKGFRQEERGHRKTVNSCKVTTSEDLCYYPVDRFSLKTRDCFLCSIKTPTCIILS